MASRQAPSTTGTTGSGTAMVTSPVPVTTADLAAMATAPPRPASGVHCGDFNITDGDAVYAELAAPFTDGTPDLLDAWKSRHPDVPHAPTCGIFDRKQWPRSHRPWRC